MELLSPAGNVEKLKYGYIYGADAAYIGLKNFSLRVKADNFYDNEYQEVCRLKKQFPGKKLHCALNIAFHNDEIDRLIQNIPYFKQYPIDAFIVQDLGIVPLLQREFPQAALHLSTQASCMNREAVKMYRRLGFSRVVMGREASLKEIAEIKDAVPDMEIECFVHGAMCIAYAGRCLMSAYLNGRSAQEGFCSHTCRWDYDVLASLGSDSKQIAESGNLVLREHKRPEEFFPVYEGENFTSVLSSKDLCMIDHLDDLKKAGVDSLKIEGRMKSVYYVALVTRAYRKALDALEGKITKSQADLFVDELYKVSHRPFSTGFYYNKSDADVAVSGASDSPFELAAECGEPFSPDEENELFEKAALNKKIRDEKYFLLCPEAKAAADKRFREHPDLNLPFVQKKEGFKMYSLEALNMIDRFSELEIISPDIVAKKIFWDEDFQLVNPQNGEVYNWVCNGHPCALYTRAEITRGTLIRLRDRGYIEGKFRNTGR
ncbi:peptidase U32 family protein [Treponema sp.]|uniref:peptidase U32 family protein n=1 Tax=Treponema sp. TaxID=166 RepID=UPI003EFF448C